MPWNEPGGNNKDPWGSGGQKKNDQGPPNLDEILKKLQKLLGGVLGGGKKNSSGKSGGNGNKNSGSKAMLWVVLVVAVVAYIYNAIYIVDEKERAVILRFGKYVETVGPGLHMYFPPVEKRFQTMVTGYRVYKLNQEMLTEDENIVQVALSIQYNISNLKDYELNVSNPTLSLQEATQSALRHVAGSSTMHEVLTEGRETLADEVKVRLQSYLDSYGTGLAVSRVNVESAQPPKQVQASFDDVIRAREDEERTKNNAQAYANQVIPEARGEAQRIIEKSNAYKAEVVALAQGQSSRFISILNAYDKAPNVTRERLYLSTMQEVLSKSTKVLVDDKKSGNVFYLPLDKLMKKPADDKSSDTKDGLSAAAQSIIANQAMNHSKQSNSRRTGRTGQ